MTLSYDNKGPLQLKINIKTLDPININKEKIQTTSFTVICTCIYASKMILNIYAWFFVSNLNFNQSMLFIDKSYTKYHTYKIYNCVFLIEKYHLILGTIKQNIQIYNVFFLYKIKMVFICDNSKQIMLSENEIHLKFQTIFQFFSYSANHFI